MENLQNLQRLNGTELGGDRSRELAMLKCELSQVGECSELGGKGPCEPGVEVQHENPQTLESSVFSGNGSSEQIGVDVTACSGVKGGNW